MSHTLQLLAVMLACAAAAVRAQSFVPNLAALVTSDAASIAASEVLDDALSGKFEGASPSADITFDLSGEKNLQQINIVGVQGKCKTYQIFTSKSSPTTSAFGIAVKSGSCDSNEVSESVFGDSVTARYVKIAFCACEDGCDVANAAPTPQPTALSSGGGSTGIGGGSVIDDSIIVPEVFEPIPEHQIPHNPEDILTGGGLPTLTMPAPIDQLPGDVTLPGGGIDRLPGGGGVMLPGGIDSLPGGGGLLDGKTVGGIDTMVPADVGNIGDIGNIGAIGGLHNFKKRNHLQSVEDVTKAAAAAAAAAPRKRAICASPNLSIASIQIAAVDIVEEEETRSMTQLKTSGEDEAAASTAGEGGLSQTALISIVGAGAAALLLLIVIGFYCLSHKKSSAARSRSGRAAVASSSRRARPSFAERGSQRGRGQFTNFASQNIYAPANVGGAAMSNGNLYGAARPDAVSYCAGSSATYGQPVGSTYSPASPDMYQSATMGQQTNMYMAVGQNYHAASHSNSSQGSYGNLQSNAYQ